MYITTFGAPQLLLLKRKISIATRISGILLLLLVSTKPTMAQSYSTSQIPEGFPAPEGILLIQNDMNKDSTSLSLSMTYSVRTDLFVAGNVNKGKMADYADKNLTFKHAYSSQGEVLDSTGQYADLNTYRYALVISLIKHKQYMRGETSNPSTNFQSTNYQPIFRFYLYDRKSHTTYAELGHGSSIFMWGFKSAIKKISKPS